MDSVRKRIKKILVVFPEKSWYRGYTLFEQLIAIILSQNTSDEASSLGFDNLRAKFHVVPRILASANLDEIKECIKPAGLYNIKAPRIKDLARIVVDQYEGEVEALSRMPADMARQQLMKIPGIGYKTADVFLSIAAGGQNFPVDTHLARIAKRWKLVGNNGGYEATRRAFEARIPPAERERTHITLIDFGREFCRARAPRCEICPVYRECEWEGKKR